MESVSDFVKRQFLEHYGKTLSTPTLSDWAEDLQGFKFFHIERAFARYRQQGKPYAPKSGEIVQLCAMIKSSEYKSSSKKGIEKKCSIEGCNAPSEEIMMGTEGHCQAICRKHDEVWVLENRPDSVYANIIRGNQKCTEEMKKLGISGEEYFKREHPDYYKIIKKQRAQANKDEVRRKVTTAIQDFYEAKLSREDRASISATLRDIAASAKKKEELHRIYSGDQEVNL